MQSSRNLKVFDSKLEYSKMGGSKMDGRGWERTPLVEEEVGGVLWVLCVQHHLHCHINGLCNNYYY